jgi:hypothetical protein
MSIRVLFATLFILVFSVAHSQEKYVVDWDFTGQSFEAFVLKAESQYPVKFFYNREWVKDLTLGSYGEKRLLNEILDTLFKGESINYYALESGNIILTKYFAIKILKDKQVENLNYIPGMDYSQDEGLKSNGGNLVVDIGNPAERNRTGHVTISGYIENQEKESVAG